MSPHTIVPNVFIIKINLNRVPILYTDYGKCEKKYSNYDRLLHVHFLQLVINNV